MRRLTLLAALLGAACAEAVPRAEVPEAPIAFVRQQAAQGIVGLDEFRAALRIGPADREKYHRRKTTLSLLSVPSGEIDVVPEAGLGSVPLDWSADGRRLLIGRREPSGALTLHTWNRLTGAWTRASGGPSVSLAAFADGPIHLAYATPRPGSVDVANVVLDLGRRGHVVLPSEEGAVDPDVSPDGRTVIFTRPSPRRLREGLILSVRIDDPEPRVLTRGSHPRFSRDGRWISFTRQHSTRDGRVSSDVWLMRADGTAKRPMATSSYDEEYPAVSPEGRYVVFASARAGDRGSQLYLVRATDGREIQLTHSGQNSRPVW